MTVVFGAYAAPAAPSMFGLSATWVGCDGSTWNLTDYKTARLVLTSEGVSGLLWPEFQPQVTTSPALNGQRLTGMSIAPRYVDLPLYMRAGDSTEFLSLFSEFMRSWSPTRPGTLTITSGPSSRSIRLRLNPESTPLTRDPVYAARLGLSVSAVADDPLWTSGWVDGFWDDGGDPHDFFSDASGRLFWISPSQTFDSATIGNPGDVPVWPRWQVTATAGALSGTMSVDGGVIGFPAIELGKTLIIDTDPHKGYADLGHMSGDTFVPESEAEGLLEPYDPRPVPVGSEVPIAFALSGPGEVSMTFQTKYWLGIGNG